MSFQRKYSCTVGKKSSWPQSKPCSKKSLKLLAWTAHTDTCRVLKTFCFCHLISPLPPQKFRRKGNLGQKNNRHLRWDSNPQPLNAFGVRTPDLEVQCANPLRHGGRYDSMIKELTLLQKSYQVKVDASELGSR